VHHFAALDLMCLCPRAAQTVVISDAFGQRVSAVDLRDPLTVACHAHTVANCRNALVGKAKLVACLLRVIFGQISSGAYVSPVIFMENEESANVVDLGYDRQEDLAGTYQTQVGYPTLGRLRR